LERGWRRGDIVEIVARQMFKSRGRISVTPSNADWFLLQQRAGPRWRVRAAHGGVGMVCRRDFAPPIVVSCCVSGGNETRFASASVRRRPACSVLNPKTTLGTPAWIHGCLLHATTAVRPGTSVCTSRRPAQGQRGAATMRDVRRPRVRGTWDCHGRRPTHERHAEWPAASRRWPSGISSGARTKWYASAFDTRPPRPVFRGTVVTACRLVPAAGFHQQNCWRPEGWRAPIPTSSAISNVSLALAFAGRWSSTRLVLTVRSWEDCAGRYSCIACHTPSGPVMWDSVLYVDKGMVLIRDGQSL